MNAATPDRRVQISTDDDRTAGIDVQVVVVGRTNSGKTTVALIISEALQSYGFDPVIFDEDSKPELIVAHQEKRIEKLVRKGAKVVIRQASLNRDPVVKEQPATA